LIPSFIAISIFPSLFEHRVYLPIIGIFIFLLETDLLKNLHKKRLLLKVGFPIILILSLAAFQHSRSFKNDFYFWKNVTHSSPHLALGHSYMGEQYLSRGQIDKAVSEYKQAVALNPGQRGAHNTLGVIYGSRKMYWEAEKEFKAELSYHPDAVDSMVNLAQLYFLQQKFKESEELLKKSIKINPGYVKGYEALAIYYYNRGKIAEARYYIEQLRKKGVKVRPELLKGLGLEQ
jgi:tetratricopeptide (TPR) repeat protein